MINSTVQDGCFDSTESDFFAGIFHNRPAKVASVILCITRSIILIPMVYGIIWYEKYGSNQKCTLINKLVSSLCWSCFEWFIAIQTVDMFRYVFGPLSSTACLTVNNLRFVIYKQQMLLMDAIIIIRYIYIFWLKNVAAFNDDFWHIVINIWIVGFSIVTQIFVFWMPGCSSLYYYICTGKNPLVDQKIPLKNATGQQFLTAISILLHIYVLVRIHLYNKKHSHKSCRPGINKIKLFLPKLNCGKITAIF